MLDAVLPALTQLVRGVQRRTSLEDHLQSVVEETARLFGAEHASVRLLNPAQTHLVAACRTGQPVHLDAVEFQPGEGLVGWIVENESVLCLDDPTQDARFVPKPGFTAMGCFLGAPLLSNRACLGVLSLIRPGRPFSEAEQQLLELVAAICAPYLEIARLSRLSRVDPLTGALNRRGLEEAYAPETLDASTRFAVVMVDIDRFKSINDTHGHIVGDEVLRHVARLLSQVLRTSDAIVRYGGEEFLLMFPGVGLSQALRIAERARRAVESHEVPVGQVVLSVTVSMGVGVQGEGESLEALLKRADAALYRAKEDGRNRVHAAA
ncbi:MAG: sensor domain-containing diguanylate cyclase [Myxococcota bacterium]